MPDFFKSLLASLFTYLIDVVLAVLLIVAGGLLDLFAPPFQRQIFLDDQSIMYPHKADTISNIAVLVIAWFVPAILIILAVMIRSKSVRVAFIAILGLAVTAAFTILTTDVIKVLAGRPRPDFLSRCDPDPSSSTENLICRGSAKLIREGRLSFPSGHTSSITSFLFLDSFAGLGYLAFVLSGQFFVFLRKGFMLKLLLFYIPFCAAVMVGLTRVSDYRHHWQDVLGGAIIGTAVAYFSYRQYFPVLISAKAHLPNDSRSEEFQQIEEQEEDEDDSAIKNV